MRTRTTPWFYYSILFACAFAALFFFSSPNTNTTATCEAVTVVHPRVLDYDVQIKEAVAAFEEYSQVELNDATYLRLLMRIRDMVREVASVALQLEKNREKLEEARASACYEQLSAHIDAQFSLHEALERSANAIQSHINAALDTTTTLWSHDNALERVSLRLTLKRTDHLLNNDYIASLPSNSSIALIVAIITVIVLFAIAVTIYFVTKKSQQPLSPPRISLEQPSPRTPFFFGLFDTPKSQTPPPPPPPPPPPLSPTPQSSPSPLQSPQNHPIIAVIEDYASKKRALLPYFIYYLAVSAQFGTSQIEEIAARIRYNDYNRYDGDEVIRTKFQSYVIRIEGDDTFATDELEKLYKLYPIYDINQPFIRQSRFSMDDECDEKGDYSNYSNYATYMTTAEQLYAKGLLDYARAVMRNVASYAICFVKQNDDFGVIVNGLKEMKIIELNGYRVSLPYEKIRGEVMLLNRFAVLSRDNLVAPSPNDILSSNQNIVTILSAIQSPHLRYVAYLAFVRYGDIADALTIRHYYRQSIELNTDDIAASLASEMDAIDKRNNADSIYATLYPVEAPLPIKLLRHYLLHNYSFLVRFNAYREYNLLSNNAVFSHALMTAYKSMIDDMIQEFVTSDAMKDINAGIAQLIRDYDTDKKNDIVVVLSNYIEYRLNTVKAGNPRKDMLSSIVTNNDVRIQHAIYKKLKDPKNYIILTPEEKDKIYYVIPLFAKLAFSKMNVILGGNQQHVELVVLCALYNIGYFLKQYNYSQYLLNMFCDKVFDITKQRVNFDIFDNQKKFHIDSVRELIDTYIIREMKKNLCNQRDMYSLIQCVYPFSIFENLNTTSWILPVIIQCLINDTIPDNYVENIHTHIMFMTRDLSYNRFVTNNIRFGGIIGSIKDSLRRYQHIISDLKFDVLNIVNTIYKDVDLVTFAAMFHATGVYEEYEIRKKLRENKEANDVTELGIFAKPLSLIIFDEDYYLSKGLDQNAADTLLHELNTLFMKIKISHAIVGQNTTKEVNEKQTAEKERMKRQLPVLVNKMTDTVAKMQILLRANIDNMSDHDMKTMKHHVDKVYNELQTLVMEVETSAGVLFALDEIDEKQNGVYSELCENAMKSFEKELEKFNTLYFDVEQRELVRLFEANQLNMGDENMLIPRRYF